MLFRSSSISILARRLRHLLPEPEPEETPALMFGTEPCPGHCRRLSDLEACDNPCANARDRRLILLVLRMKRESETSPAVMP